MPDAAYASPFFALQEPVLRDLLFASIGRRLDESNPMVDARLPDGGRINVIIPPLALEGPVVAAEGREDLDLTARRSARQGAAQPRGAEGPDHAPRRRAASRAAAAVLPAAASWRT